MFYYTSLIEVSPDSHAYLREIFNTTYKNLLQAKGKYDAHVRAAMDARSCQANYALLEREHQDLFFILFFLLGSRLIMHAEGKNCGIPYQ